MIFNFKYFLTHIINRSLKQFTNFILQKDPYLVYNEIILDTLFFYLSKRLDLFFNFIYLIKINIFELKRDQAKLYFRPSGTGPDVRFYIFGKVETYLEEINTVMKIIKEKYS